MRRLIMFLAMATAVSVAGPVANAASATYNFSDCLRGACGSLSGSIGTLTLSEMTNSVSFSFSSTSDVLKVGSFISGLLLNGNVGTAWSGIWNSPQTLSNYNYSTTPGISLRSARGYNWGTYRPPGATGDRLVNGDNANWTVADAGVDLSDFTTNAKIAVQLDGQGARGRHSARIGTVAAVPEPETYAMLLAGIGVIGAIATRRRISL